jgi:hypothetical protein
MEANKQALVLDESDNVATLLTDTSAGDTIILKGSAGTIVAADDIPYGHKIALVSVAEGAGIVKYGHRIGIATKAIPAGAWIHLHNMRSSVDITFNKRIYSCTPNQ